MAKLPIQIRVDEEELEQWKARAAACDLSLSAWIRLRCVAFPAPDKDQIRITGELKKAKDAGITDQTLRDAEEKAERHRPGTVAQEIARRIGHAVGCECMQCVQAARFLKQQATR